MWHYKSRLKYDFVAAIYVAALYAFKKLDGTFYAPMTMGFIKHTMWRPPLHTLATPLKTTSPNPDYTPNDRHLSPSVSLHRYIFSLLMQAYC